MRSSLTTQAKSMKEPLKRKMGKPVSKGQGISLCRYGGLTMVRQRGNYGNNTFHSAPERYGFYAFPYSYVEMFLTGSTKQKEVKEGTYKRFTALDGYLWTHLKPSRQADIIAEHGSWYKVSVEGYIKALKKEYARLSPAMYKDFYGDKKVLPNRANPFIITTKDELEVFVTRETIIS